MDAKTTRRQKRAEDGLTARQRSLIARVRENYLRIEDEERADLYEFKVFEVAIFDGFVSLVWETGLIGDEGTLAALVCRTRRHIAIGPNGGVELLNAGYKGKRLGWLNAMYAPTDDMVRSWKRHAEKQPK
jgi:hypothetical protein